ncbi:glutathione S-transferase family protein [Bordetella bronchiseptica]|uniref:glutathione S-transferase family protein n=1 Tax=Bordetella bronchiseptica TaxID=518 RepID=UPI001F40DE0E|nr:glutathione S-transferase family protein [Bordetella bronchiseptica]
MADDGLCGPAPGAAQHGAGPAHPDHRPVPGHLAGLRAVADRLPGSGHQRRPARQPAGGNHLALHPFGQIPTYEADGLALFESGAIVLHIAERHGGLLPDDAHARARAIAWMFAALDTVEPPIFERAIATVLERDAPWYAQRLQVLEDRIRQRLASLSRRLGQADWLDGPFSAGDLLMVTVLRRLNGSDMLDAYPNLAAYVARGQARPACQRAFDAQRAAFNAAPGS